MMLANRLSPTTSRRPTLNSSTPHPTHHKNHKRIYSHYQKKSNEPNLNIGRRKNKTLKDNLEFEDGNIRPPPSKFSTSFLISNRDSLNQSPFVSSQIPLSSNLDRHDESSNDIQNGVYSSLSSTSVINDLETSKCRNTVYGTTR